MNGDAHAIGEGIIGLFRDFDGLLPSATLALKRLGTIPHCDEAVIRGGHPHGLHMARPGRVHVGKTAFKVGAEAVDIGGVVVQVPMPIRD